MWRSGGQGDAPEDGGEDLKRVRAGVGGHLEEGGSRQRKQRGPPGWHWGWCVSATVRKLMGLEQGGH